MDEPTADTDTTLFLRVQRGDRASFDTLMARHGSSVLNIIHRHLGRNADAEALAQEVFFRVYRARGSFEPRARFTTWLFRITANLCLNEIRSRRSGGRSAPKVSLSTAGDDGEEGLPVPADEAAATPVESAGRRELVSRVREALAALPESQRMALILNKYEGLSYEDVGDVLELSIPAVKSLLFRARDSLKAKLAPLLQGDSIRETLT